jgi:hypothetical protein
VLADVLHAAIDESQGRSVYETVNKRSVRVLKDGLNPPRDGRRLSPIVILHRDDENVFDFPVIPVVPMIPVILSPYGATTHCRQESKHSEKAAISEKQH